MTKKILIAILVCTATLLVHTVTAKPAHLPPLTYPFADQQEFWINSPPLNDQQLKNRPVLVMFWTYGCYNCRNSLAWINDINARFADRGLLVLGVHTPEFAHERDRQRVEAKTKEYGIKFPVMIDNDFTYWKEMNNQWWPSFYLADGNGIIKGAFIGETHLGTDKSVKIIALIEDLLDN